MDKYYLKIIIRMVILMKVDERELDIRIEDSLKIQSYRYKDRDENRSAYIELLAGLDTRYQLTLSFTKGTFETKSKELLNEFLKRVNRKIYKGRYNRGETFLRGFVVREFTYGMDTDHYHILIEDSPYMPNTKRMEAIIDKKVAGLNKSLRNDKRSNSCIESAYLQDYYNEGDNKLEKYLTKVFEKQSYSIEKAADCIGYLTDSKVDFGRFIFGRG